MENVINVVDNEITQVSGLDPIKLSRLHTLELRGNKLETTDGVSLPNLKNLFLVRAYCCFFYLNVLFPIFFVYILSNSHFSEKAATIYVMKHAYSKVWG